MSAGDREDFMEGFTCPAPANVPERILMAHGGGGRLMHDLIERVFQPVFDNPFLAERHDGARLPIACVQLADSGAQVASSAALTARSDARLAFTTDAYVVRPLFFPGGDIGKLAVCGTVNDLAMCGARPLYLSAAFVLEEGLPIQDLQRIVCAMQTAASDAGAMLVTGDTKVVDRGKGDGIYVTTAGIGIIESTHPVEPRSVRVGDAVLLSGDIGRHGIAILAARQELALETSIESDCASLSQPILALLSDGLDIHCLRDCTRGGLAAALVEIATTSGCEIVIAERNIPVHAEVMGACEILGLDPLHIANEGRFVCFLPEQQADRALAILRQHAVGAGAQRIGRVESGPTAHPRVILDSVYGASRTLDLPSGELLPRIC